jgi:cytochrome c-type biogenesis protein CcmH/NrfG
MLNLARALVAIDQGRVSDDALRLFAAVSAQAPDEPLPWFYQALAASQSGRKADARRLWEATLQRLPADDPRRDMARQMRDDAAR